uniref:Uncharacterized protein n=1 Tax=Arundo donax TaxID=35708 RepID=A0A0A8YT95_ARUDO
MDHILSRITAKILLNQVNLLYLEVGKRHGMGPPQTQTEQLSETKIKKKCGGIMEQKHIW